MGIEAESFGTEILYQAQLLEKLKEILGLQKEIKDFIGSHPVSLERSHVDVLLNEDYLVCEKSDGIRIMLLIDSHNVFLYDRKNKIYKSDLVTEFDGTFLFDGELYKECDYYVYAIFDTLIFKTVSCTELNLLERLKMAVDFTKPHILSGL